MNKNEKYALGIVSLLIFLGAYLGGYLTQFGIPPPSFNVGNNNNYVPTDSDKENWKNGIGRYNVLETVVDSLDIATERTSATNYKIYWYTRRGGTWIYHETGDNKYVTLQPEDGGYLWVVVTIPSGQAFYVDYQKTAQDEWIEDTQYVDVDADGVKEFAFKYNMKGHQLPNSGYPSVSFMGYILTYDSSFTGLNNLGNDTAIGQTTTTIYYDYYLSMSAVKKGIAIYKVEVKVGTTDETKIRLKKLNIPGIGYLDGSSFTTTTTASDIRFTYSISTNFYGALYLKHPSNAQNRYDSTLGLEFTLANSDDILITLTYYYLVAQTEAGTSASDSFYAQE